MNILRYLRYSVILIICVFIFSSAIYAYKSYSIGDESTYNDIKFHVIKDSSSEEEYVTVLKDFPLSYEEIINYSSELDMEVINNGGYGSIRYCAGDGSTNPKYDNSYIKSILDNWIINTFDENDLGIDDFGYKVRLITFDELINNFGYNQGIYQISSYRINPDYTPKWVYNNSYTYWTMSNALDKGYHIWKIDSAGTLVYHDDAFKMYCVRPVVTIKKDAIKEESEDEKIIIMK